MLWVCCFCMRCWLMTAESRKTNGLYHRIQATILCTVITATFRSHQFLSGNLQIQCEHHDIVCRLALRLLQYFYFLFSHCLTLFFFSLSVLHTCKACECGSLRDDSSVAHLIVAWPYLGCPEIHSSVLVCRREEQAMQGCQEELLSSLLFFRTRTSNLIPEVSLSSEGQILLPVSHGYFRLFHRIFSDEQQLRHRCTQMFSFSQSHIQHSQQT